MVLLIRDGAILPNADAVPSSIVIEFCGTGGDMRDDDFRPRLGKVRADGQTTIKSFRNRILQAAGLAGGLTKRRGRFHGSRIGRGAGVGRVLAGRDRWAGWRGRRVVVKARLVRLAGRNLKAAQLHLRYIQRDGVTREGEPGQLYDADRDRADGKAFLERSHGDRHQFRFIVAAEDADQYEDLKSFTRRLMQQMEQDLGTKLDWVAVDHFNTGHPHSHVILRGRDDRGQDLVIARDYIARGLRERAQEIVTLDLGPRTDIEIADRLRQEVAQERFTNLDRQLLREAGDSRVVSIGVPSSDEHIRFRQSLKAGRLQMLKRLELAEEVQPGLWRLTDDLEPTLRRMGERGDIIKTMHRAMTEKGIGYAASEYAIYDPADPQAREVIGRVVRLGLSDEINDRHFMVVDGVDGRSHYVELGKLERQEPMAEGNIIAVAARATAPRQVDRTVAEIAAQNGGHYSLELHRRHDPSARPAYIESHIRRLEALRRATEAVTRDADGIWAIGGDHLEKVTAYEAGRIKDSPVEVKVLSSLALEKLIDADAGTWLDRELVGDAPTALRSAGFGKLVQDARQRRQQWLVTQGLAEEREGQVVYRAGLLNVLRRRELARIASQLSEELGLSYVEAASGQRIEGTYRRSVTLASGRMAVIAKAREFTLVPWRPSLEMAQGRHIEGIIRGNTFEWRAGRSRTPGIS
ncbi:relaxase/mobilization nuclease RlxS [Ferrovibrio sp.]|uniref:relaxase/mobilization nuclease RlxS n=1 Tax=Ferrovibrio sp. TaxID=1917215 RepID=UPI00311F0980